MSQDSQRLQPSCTVTQFLSPERSLKYNLHIFINYCYHNSTVFYSVTLLLLLTHWADGLIGTIVLLLLLLLLLLVVVVVVVVVVIVVVVVVVVVVVCPIEP